MTQQLPSRSIAIHRENVHFFTLSNLDSGPVSPDFTVRADR